MARDEGNSGLLKLNLGCGKTLLSGWANIDWQSFDGAMQLDLTKPLPFETGSVHCIYSEHFVEHITRFEASSLFKEALRVLRPGGVLRISTPDLRKLVDEYRSGRLTEWQDVDWIPATSCRLLNEGMRAWGHQFVYDSDELCQLLKEAGFQLVEHAGWRQSKHKSLAQLESRPYHCDLIIEATKF